MRFAFAVAFGVTVTILACSGDDNGGGNGSSSPLPPNGCPAEPCKAGTLCFQQPEPSCNGTWYCHTDGKWYCSPQDSGGPGGPPPDGAFMEETGGPMDASMTNDATGN